jgi:FtsP/CotA-like multicopper oxidase with cupredoxin domain
MKLRRRSSVLAVIALACAGVTWLPVAQALPPNAPRTGMVCTPGLVSGGVHTFNLVANTGHIDTPDGNSVYMWSYASLDPPNPEPFQSPGPVLCVTQGEQVRVTLRNDLPESTSIVFPGQDNPVAATGGTPGLLTTEAAPGATVTYAFTAGQPGTYHYESGTSIAKQVEMGLAGALVVRPAIGAGYAYGASTQFDPTQEYLLLLSEIDPDLHHAVETGTAYDVNALHNRYFAINGREFPDTIQDNDSILLPSQPYGALVRVQPTSPTGLPALIRMINVGATNHPFHPHGNHTTQIAQDGRLVPRTEHFGETIGSGQTEDFLLQWVDVDAWNPTSNPIPEAQPNYRNLTFKDGNTWYAGTPYLGYKGTLPTGTVSQNICGEWYFPWHSHALNEFTNYDQGFGGMGTLLRVDPPGGCFAAPGATGLVGGVLKAGTAAALAVADGTYYQVNPKTTTRTTATSATLTTGFTVASATGFPSTNGFYVRVDNEDLQVTAGAGTTAWTVARGQLGSSAATHLSGATVTALTTSWYAGFSGVPAGAANLKVTYTGHACGVTTTANSCPSVGTNQPVQTVRVCNWTVGGANGCATPTGAGWVTLPAPPTNPAAIGSADVTSTWTLPGPTAAYLGTGSYSGQVRVLVYLTRYTGSTATPALPVSSWGDLMKIVYDAP